MPIKRDCPYPNGLKRRVTAAMDGDNLVLSRTTSSAHDKGDLSEGFVLSPTAMPSEVLEAIRWVFAWCSTPMKLLKTAKKTALKAAATKPAKKAAKKQPGTKGISSLLNLG